MSLKNAFGQRIKELRESLSLSQEEFAEKIDVHRNSLIRIESGKGFVSHETLENIHSFLQIPYKDIFNFNEPPQKNIHKAIQIRLDNLKEEEYEYFLTCIDAYMKLKNK